MLCLLIIAKPSFAWHVCRPLRAPCRRKHWSMLWRRLRPAHRPPLFWTPSPRYVGHRGVKERPTHVCRQHAQMCQHSFGFLCQTVWLGRLKLKGRMAGCSLLRPSWVFG